MEPTVSIIVPVYNGEKTLRRCVDSILNQEYTDFELILVDDGSRDGSGAICDSYRAQDSRVQVIHKENSGVSDSRNRALELARGIYLQFLDSDDWITPDATKLLVRAAENHRSDLVIADFYRVVGERVSRKGDIREDTVMNREEFAGYMMKSPADYYYGVIWNKLYRRELVERHRLRMNPEIQWCEDFLFNLEYILHAERFYALQTPVYYYVKTKGSLVARNTSIANSVRMKRMVFAYYNNFYKHVLDPEDYEKNRLQIYRFLVNAAKDGLVLPAALPGNWKLGEERSSFCLAAAEREGFLAEEYRSRKLLDRCLESVALKNKLTLAEARQLLCLSYLREAKSRKEMADFAGVTPRSLNLSLQKLSARGLIRVEGGRGVRVVFLPPAEPVLAQLAEAQNDYDQMQFAGLTREEQIQYAVLSEKIKGNIREALLKNIKKV